MLKLIVTLALIALFSFLAARGFAAQLEAVSATRARRDEDVERRSLELGMKGRLIIAGVFAAVFIVLMVASNLSILSVILGSIISIALCAANIYLRKHDIYVFPSIFLLWITTSIAASCYAHMTTGQALTNVYSTISFITFLVLIISTLVMKSSKAVKAYKEEEREARKIEREARKAEQKQRKKQRGDDEDDEDDDYDDDSNGSDWPEEELRKEEILEFVVKILGIVILIAAVVVLGVWLEMKFDFFPPYRF